jgi:hypothetical protein
MAISLLNSVICIYKVHLEKILYLVHFYDNIIIIIKQSIKTINEGFFAMVALDCIVLICSSVLIVLLILASQY